MPKNPVDPHYWPLHAHHMMLDALLEPALGLDEDGPRNMVTVIGKDGMGNWWVQIITREEAWGKIGKWTRDQDGLQ